jgi:GntR family transcriptional regulator
MAVTFNINTGSDTPIYKQITDQARLAVTRGRLAVGDQLPSVRALAEELVVNPNTVARAYADLMREGLLESRAGRACSSRASGRFIRARKGGGGWSRCSTR